MQPGSATHRDVRNPGRPTITVDGRYAASAPVPATTPVPRRSTDGEGEQVTAHVRTIYGPCPQGRRPGARRGPDAQPQLHRHRAHFAGLDPRGRRRCGEVAGVARI